MREEEMQVFAKEKSVRAKTMKGFMFFCFFGNVSKKVSLEWLEENVRDFKRRVDNRLSRG